MATTKTKGSTYSILQRYITAGIPVKLKGKSRAVTVRLLGITNDNTPFPVTVGFFDSEGKSIGYEHTTADQVTPILYPLNRLSNLSEAELHKLGENVHAGNNSIKFFTLEGELQSSLDYDGDYYMHYRSGVSQIAIDVPGVPFRLANQLIRMGFAVDLCDDEYVVRID